MKLNKKGNKDNKDMLIEAALHDLPRKELPRYVEQRILESLRHHGAVIRKLDYRPLSRLQWASMTLGFLIGVYCGTLFTKVSTVQEQNTTESVFNLYQMSEPSLLDMY